VLSTIELDYQIALETCKINDIAADRRLSPELAAIELPVPDPIPEAFFGFSLRKAQIPCSAGVHSWFAPGRRTPQLPIAAQWAPSSPTRGEATLSNVTKDEWLNFEEHRKKA